MDLLHLRRNSQSFAISRPWRTLSAPDNHMQGHFQKPRSNGARELGTYEKSLPILFMVKKVLKNERKK